MALPQKSWISTASCFKSSGIKSKRDREINSGIQVSDKGSSRYAHAKTFSFFRRLTGNCLKSPNRVDYATPLNMSSQIFLPCSKPSPKPYRSDERVRPNSCKTLSTNELHNMGMQEKSKEWNLYFSYCKSDKIVPALIKDKGKQRLKDTANSKGSNPNLTSKSETNTCRGFNGFQHRRSLPQEQVVKKSPKSIQSKDPEPRPKTPENAVPRKKSPTSPGEPSPIPMSCDAVAEILRSENPQSVVLVDCRTFVVYNDNRIVGALNVSCSDCITRKRLLCGRIRVEDLVSGPADAKERFREALSSPDDHVGLALYDEDASDASLLPKTHPLKVVSASLAKVRKKVFYVKGGMKEFHRLHGSLCIKSSATTKVQSDSIAYSPTTQIVEENIDSAVMSQVLPFLYIGNERDSTNEEMLSGLGITHVINVTSHLPCPLPKIEYKRLPASDSSSQNLKQYFDEAVAFIDEAKQSGGKVLVHCQAGVSRSATIGMAYLMTRYSMSMMAAFRTVKRCRPIVAPNFNFLGQLLELEARLGVSDRTDEGAGEEGSEVGGIEERVKDLLLSGEGEPRVLEFFDAVS